MEKFTASQSWVYAFLRRNNLSIRRRTHISQKLPEDFEEKIVDFQRFIINARKKYGYPLSQIGNADQTPLTFDLPSATTVNAKGAKTVTITTTGHKKDRFTVMLACTAYGGTLPPYVVFKRKTLPKSMIWPKGIIVRCQENGWMDNTLIMDWIQNVWGKRPGAMINKSLLVLDAFRAHRTEEVKKSLSRDYKTTLSIIPGGMTSILQPLNVSINKPMKVLLQQQWNDWYSNGNHTFTAGGKMRKAELNVIAQLIITAWQQIDPAIIQKAFKKCSISNEMDGSEDDVLFEDLIDKNCQKEQTSTQSHDEDLFDDDFYSEVPQCMTLQEFEDFYGRED